MAQRHTMMRDEAKIMSYDIPQMHIADDSPEARVIESIMIRDRVTPEEAIRRALRQMPVATTRKYANESRVTDEELAIIDRFLPNLGALDDVTDAQWENVLKGARRMNRDGFSKRA